MLTVMTLILPSFLYGLHSIWVQTAQLSRFTSWQRSMGGSYYYRAGAIKEWEVWGRSDLPSSDGSWDGWTKLADCESIKPCRMARRFKFRRRS